MLMLSSFNHFKRQSIKALYVCLGTIISFNSLAQQSLIEGEQASSTIGCSLHLISQLSGANQNGIVQYRFIDNDWSDALIVHDSPSTFSKRPSIVQTINNQVIAVWVERKGSSSQLLYKAKPLDGQWPEDPIVLTSSGGHKTAPIVFNSMSGQVYLAWASDQNGNDDIFFASWANGEWSSTESLSDTNEYPDISPAFSYEKNKQGALDLILSWQQRDADGIYQESSFLLEYDLEIDSVLAQNERACSKQLEHLALPTEVKSGFIFRPDALIDNHQRVRLF